MLLAVAEDDLKAMLPRGALHMAGQHGEKRVLDVGDHQSEHAGAAATQASRDAVAGIAQRLDRGEHAFARLLADLARTVDHMRSGGGGDRGVPRDVLERVRAR